jgi:hypothetical protein
MDKIKENLLKDIELCTNELEETEPVWLNRNQAIYSNICLKDSNLDSKLKQHEETKHWVLDLIHQLEYDLGDGKVLDSNKLKDAILGSDEK